ncbi:MFS transporter [Acerihabitans sp. KWT182]|uniref:MFS transporter n=1 Tax=Acerihabitans sp. KWT182 TaxID=3157919 RepID=A0AAU7QB96_9GAMM
MSIALPHIADEFNIRDARTIGAIQSAFFWAYALMQIPSGVIADKFKRRTVIVTATILWGLSQALVALCTGTYSLFVARIGLGLTESPVMPAGAKLMGVWLTPTERGRGAMLLDGGAPLGTALGAVVVGGLITLFDSWRMAFVIAGVGTVIMGVVAWYYIRNRPDEHKGVNAAELAHIEAENGCVEARGGKFRLGDVKPYLKQRNVIALIVGWCCYSTVFYGLMTWLPLYLQHEYQFNIKDMSGTMGLLFILCFIGQLTGGYVMDRLRKLGFSDNKVFHGMLSISAIVAGLGIFIGANTHNATAVIILLAIAMFPLRWGSIYWSIPSLLGAQQVAGTILGTMNFSSNLWSAIVPLCVGVLVQYTGSYYSTMMVFVAAAVCYLICSWLIDFNKPMHIANEEYNRALV